MIIIDQNIAYIIYITLLIIVIKDKPGLQLWSNYIQINIMSDLCVDVHPSKVSLWYSRRVWQRADGLGRPCCPGGTSHQTSTRWTHMPSMVPERAAPTKLCTLYQQKTWWRDRNLTCEYWCCVKKYKLKTFADCSRARMLVILMIEKYAAFSYVLNVITEFIFSGTQ